MNTQIDRLITEKGLRPSFVAEKMGKTMTRLWQIRKGATEPKASELKSLSEILEVPIETLLSSEKTNA